MADKQQIQIL